MREMLRLYGDQRDPSIAKQIEAIKSIKSEPVIRQLPFAGKITFGRGLKITMECEESAFEGLGLYLFGAIMERFFSKYVSINTFVETVLVSNERGVIKTWQARTGQTQIL